MQTVRELFRYLAWRRLPHFAARQERTIPTAAASPSHSSGMNPATDTIQTCLEQLCSHGCRAVRGYITELEQGRNLPETTHLNPAERQLLLHELHSIMAVYDRCGR